MTLNNHNGNISSLSEAVRNEINCMPHVKTAIADGLVNYSALARKLMPVLSEKLGSRKLNEESVVVSIKRYADELGKWETKISYIDMFANSAINLQDNMCYSTFKKNNQTVSLIEKKFDEEDWRVGEMRVMISGAEHVTTIMKQNRMGNLTKEMGGEIIYSIDNAALLTLMMPFESFSTYGVIAEISSVLARKGISIDLLSTPPNIHILVSEKDAERTYATLRQLIEDSKKILNERKK